VLREAPAARADLGRDSERAGEALRRRRVAPGVAPPTTVASFFRTDL